MGNSEYFVAVHARNKVLIYHKQPDCQTSPQRASEILINATQYGSEHGTNFIQLLSLKVTTKNYDESLIKSASICRQVSADIARQFELSVGCVNPAVMRAKFFVCRCTLLSELGVVSI